MNSDTVLAFMQLSKTMHSYKGSVGITHELLKLCNIDEIIDYYLKGIGDILNYNFRGSDKCVFCGTKEKLKFVEDDRLNIAKSMCNECEMKLLPVHKMLDDLYLITKYYIDDIDINVLSNKYKIYDVEYSKYYQYSNGRIKIPVSASVYSYDEYVNKFLPDLENIDDDDFDEGDYYHGFYNDDYKIYKNECRNIYKNYYITLPDIEYELVLNCFMDIYDIVHYHYILKRLEY